MIPRDLLPLADHLWQSTVFAGVVWLLTLALRRNRAAVRHGLWVAASVKFLTPLALLAAVGSSLEWRKAPVAVRPQIAVVERISEPFAVLDPPQPIVWTAKRSNRLPTILIGVWLCGFSANMIAWWRRWRRARVAVRTASPMAVGWPIWAMSGPSRLEPGVFGVFRPFLLVPDGITERLTPAQFEAVVVHELCHVRRRDNLAAAIHMIVEALFWFHPLVWWIEARLVEERERACDEAVLRMGSDPQDYAEGIVNVAKLYVESPLACVAGVTGGSLARRVEAIMLNRGVEPLGLARALLVAAAGALAVGVPVALGVLDPAPLRAQGRSFETASIFSIKPVDGMIRATPQAAAGATLLEPTKLGGISGTRFTMPIGTVQSLIMDAYNLQDSQIEGLPAWAAGGEFYKIDVRTEGEIPLTTDQARVMLQALLAERFRLRARGETRQIPVYELRIAEGGSKVSPAPDDATDAAPWFIIRAIIRQRADRPVVDKTGFGGRVLTPRLDWSKGQLAEGLGLTLKAAIQPTDFLVVDSVETPRED